MFVVFGVCLITDIYRVLISLGAVLQKFVLPYGFPVLYNQSAIHCTTPVPQKQLDTSAIAAM